MSKLRVVFGRSPKDYVALDRCGNMWIDHDFILAYHDEAIICLVIVCFCLQRRVKFESSRLVDDSWASKDLFSAYIGGDDAGGYDQRVDIIGSI